MSTPSQLPTSEEDRKAAIAKIIELAKAPDLDHIEVFKNTNFTDVVFQLGKDSIAAHYCVVQKRCSNLTSLPEAVRRTKKRKNTIEMKEGFISMEILSLVLKFLYTGSMDFGSMKTQQILLLTQAARSYKLKRLQWLCEHYLQESLTIANVFPLLKQAHDLKDQRVKGFCLQYALQNYQDFISNKDGVRDLGIDLFQEVVSNSTDSKNATLLSPSPPPANTLIEDFKAIYSEMQNHDAFCTWSTGENIKFHKAFLAAKSPEFARVFADFQGENMSDWTGTDAHAKSQGIQLTGVSAEAFSYMLKHIYYKEQNIPPLPACELIPFSRKYQLKSLLELCEKVIKNNVTVDTVLKILEVCYLSVMADRKDIVDDLRRRSILFAVEHLAEINLQMLRDMDSRLSVDVLLACQAHGKGEALPEPAKISAAPTPAPAAAPAATAPAAAAPAKKDEPAAKKADAAKKTDAAAKKAEPAKKADAAKAAPAKAVNKATDAAKKPPAKTESAADLKKKAKEEAAKKKADEKKKKEDEKKKKAEEKKKKADEKKKKTAKPAAAASPAKGAAATGAAAPRKGSGTAAAAAKGSKSPPAKK